MTTFSHGHDWGWRMMSCSSRCGVKLIDYELGVPYQCGSAIRPATPEPPVWPRPGWKGWYACPDYIPGTVTNTGVILNPGDRVVISVDYGSCPGKAEAEPLDRDLSDFIAKRKAKRDARHADNHPWAAAGHTHADWSTDACPKCLLTGVEVKERGYYPKCDDYKREREAAAVVARAFSLPLTFTARLGMKQP